MPVTNTRCGLFNRRRLIRNDGLSPRGTFWQHWRLLRQPMVFDSGHSEKPCRFLNQDFNVRMVPQDRHELAGAVIQSVFNDPHEALVEKKSQLVIAI